MTEVFVGYESVDAGDFWGKGFRCEVQAWYGAWDVLWVEIGFGSRDGAVAGCRPVLAPGGCCQCAARARVPKSAQLSAKGDPRTTLLNLEISSKNQAYNE